MQIQHGSLPKKIETLSRVLTQCTLIETFSPGRHGSLHVSSYNFTCDNLLPNNHLCPQVENEWKAFVALKQDVSVTLLTRSLGKQAAQTKVESALVAEQLHQDELIKLRHKHLKLKIRIYRLEAELRDREEHARDPLHLQFEKLQAERLELEKQAEKQNEEAFKMEKKISSSLEVS